VVYGTLWSKPLGWNPTFLGLNQTFLGIELDRCLFRGTRGVRFLAFSLVQSQRHSAHSAHWRLVWLVWETSRRDHTSRATVHWMFVSFRWYRERGMKCAMGLKCRGGEDLVGAGGRVARLARMLDSLLVVWDGPLGGGDWATVALGYIQTDRPGLGRMCARAYGTWFCVTPGGNQHLDHVHCYSQNLSLVQSQRPRADLYVCVVGQAYPARCPAHDFPHQWGVSPRNR
jgi:hypothetical protein